MQRNHFPQPPRREPPQRRAAGQRSRGAGADRKDQPPAHVDPLVERGDPRVVGRQAAVNVPAVGGEHNRLDPLVGQPVSGKVLRISQRGGHRRRFVIAPELRQCLDAQCRAADRDD